MLSDDGKDDVMPKRDSLRARDRIAGPANADDGRGGGGRAGRGRDRMCTSVPDGESPMMAIALFIRAWAS